MGKLKEKGVDERKEENCYIKGEAKVEMSQEFSWKLGFPQKFATTITTIGALKNQAQSSRFRFRFLQ